MEGDSVYWETAAWFGLHGDIWAREGVTPMWLRVNDIGPEVISTGIREGVKVTVR